MTLHPSAGLDPAQKRDDDYRRAGGPVRRRPKPIIYNYKVARGRTPHRRAAVHRRRRRSRSRVARTERTQSRFVQSRSGVRP